MVDGGKHFKNREVAENCERWGTKLHTVAAYSPWVNGLVEGTNKLLLYVLARLCAPELGEDETMWDKLSTTWLDHFDKAIRILNWRLLPALKFSPKEILLGLVVNTSKTPMEVSSSFLPPSDIDTHMAYVAQQWLDGYAEAVHHAIRRKAAFDRKVLKSKAGVVEFKKGQLVQVYRDKLALTLSTERKLAPLWSPPRRITERILNSYRLEALDGTPLDGLFNARRLRGFTPKEGTALAVQQKEFEEKLKLQESEEGTTSENEVGAGSESDKEEVDEEEVAEEDTGELELEDLEIERRDDENGRDSTGFFYDEEEEDEQDDVDMGIGARVAARRRGRLHSGGGQME